MIFYQWYSKVTIMITNNKLVKDLPQLPTGLVEQLASFVKTEQDLSLITNQLMKQVVEKVSWVWFSGRQVSSLCSNFAVNVILSGEISGALIVYFCMVSNTIIKDFNIFKNDSSSLLSGTKTIMMQTFSFKRTKEAFHRRIVRALHCVQMPARS